MICCRRPLRRSASLIWFSRARSSICFAAGQHRIVFVVPRLPLPRSGGKLHCLTFVLRACIPVCLLKHLRSFVHATYFHQRSPAMSALSPCSRGMCKSGCWILHGLIHFVLPAQSKADIALALYPKRSSLIAWAFLRFGEPRFPFTKFSVRKYKSAILYLGSGALKSRQNSFLRCL